MTKGAQLSQTDGHGGTAAGWYDDPAGSGGLRWWDGSRWSENVQPAAQQPAHPQPAPTAQHAPAVHQPAAGQYAYPAAPAYGTHPGAEPRRVDPGTPVYGPFIWIITLLPALSLLLLPLSFTGFEDMIRYEFETGGSGYSMYGGLSGAALLAQSAATLFGWLIYGAGVVLAFFDRKWLLARGFDRPFHWAFAFIPAPVYPIGRSIVVRRRSGRGIAPMWVSIGLLALTLLISIGVGVWIVSVTVGLMNTTGYGSFTS
ncbi:DUF2510 domain-containing protein [Herbiconiux sp. CPCC 205716]|uniref:DUF2510 domain-containing protein n=1 Tax=Herbiconiux gentiana TaxID=2970912 RepID=A0ABT2GH46_9MICO|nr:DUF2510 domain-containing protein [Herbiconiux gentiana]MCS5715552.1 DUF2510 domain-containing protein [Herbiconiux gentiana]